MIGHLGETLPFMLPRLERALPTELTRLDRPVGAYLRENVHYTFSGLNWTPAFLNHLPVGTADQERIAHGNAEHLLGRRAGP